jgi:hypothetical protein
MLMPWLPSLLIISVWIRKDDSGPSIVVLRGLKWKVM